MKKYSINDIVPHYQPIVAIKNSEVVMYECLARFNNREGRRIGPNDINDLFENPEFLWDLFENLLPKVVDKAKKATIAVNVDACSMTDRFFYFIEHLYKKHPFLVGNIHYELTEKNIAKGLGEVVEHMEELRRFGSKIALDDFGTGSSNLEILNKIKFDHIKIDGQFLTGAVTPSGLKKLKYIVDLLKEYGCPIVGEHIENQNIARIALSLGIEYGQGYHYGAALPIVKEIQSDVLYSLTTKTA